MPHMNAHSSMIHVRMDDELKAKAIEALAAMGLTASDAVRLLFHRIVADQAFPLELKVPNAETRAAMAEAEAIVRNRKARFTNADDMFAELEKASGK
jgi:DNA-damage-inducible protein J